MNRRDIVGVVLAGGLGRRMNGADKPMLMLAGRRLVEHVIERAAPQVDQLLINANGDASRFADLNREIVADVVPGYAGPLAGIFAGHEWARRNRMDAKWLISFACDCPFIPFDLTSRLIAAADEAGVPIATAASDGRHHPVFSAWSLELPLDRDEILVKRGVRKVGDLIGSFPSTRVDFATIPFDPFFNINTPEDLVHAEELAKLDRQTHD